MSVDKLANINKWITLSKQRIKPEGLEKFNFLWAFYTNIYDYFLVLVQNYKRLLNNGRLNM